MLIAITSILETICPIDKSEDRNEITILYEVSADTSEISEFIEYISHDGFIESMQGQELLHEEIVTKIHDRYLDFDITVVLQAEFSTLHDMKILLVEGVRKEMILDRMRSVMPDRSEISRESISKIVS